MTLNAVRMVLDAVRMVLNAVHVVLNSVRMVLNAAIPLYNFVCRSIMWKKDINFCILSAYDRTQRAHRFRIALKSDIDLYENKCTFSHGLAPVNFESDMDLVRTTMAVPRQSTPRPRTLPIPLKRQGIGYSDWPGPFLYDSVPAVKEQKPRVDFKAKTFSVPITQPEIIVGSQVDDEGHSLFNLPAAGWRLPPIRRGNVGRHFFAKTDSRELPAIADKVPEKACFTRRKQRALMGFEEKTISGIELFNCLHSCLHTSTFYCASVNYNEFKKVCTLNGGNLHLNDIPLRNSISDYYENECTPDQISQRKVSNSVTVRSEPIDRCFTVFPNTVLLSLESNLLDRASSLEHCQAECSRASVNGSRPCGAINWIPHSRGCMMFEVGFDRRLVVHSAQAQFSVNKCAGELELNL
ncbi:unnamed protein product [Heligmosomoides polygyrus]|uniref:PAN domain protein n=1 Tax=Heligmosomoides polygyrus TaxID=6339 RepID=A0A183FDS9_HELPZ|nr:unnamed protein product [Heligmosomoides polygyrus]